MSRALTIWFSLAMALAACRRTHAREPTVVQDDASSGSASPSADPALQGPHVILHPSGAPPVTLRVETQTTEAQRERGLMFRQQLDELAGMIFVFPSPSHQVFWMHNTILPLDMLFITQDGHVLGIVKNATPMTDDPREVPGDSLYVLEVNGGFADRHHITDGTRVEFVHIPPAAQEMNSF